MRSYAPYENVKAQNYPEMLVLASLNDPRVPYWEALKWAAKIRELRTDRGVILVKVRTEGGHQGVSDRFDELNEWAFIYAFLIDRIAGESNDGLGTGARLRVARSSQRLANGRMADRYDASVELWSVIVQRPELILQFHKRQRRAEWSSTCDEVDCVPETHL